MLFQGHCDVQCLNSNRHYRSPHSCRLQRDPPKLSIKSWAPFLFLTAPAGESYRSPVWRQLPDSRSNTTLPSEWHGSHFKSYTVTDMKAPRNTFSRTVETRTTTPPPRCHPHTDPAELKNDSDRMRQRPNRIFFFFQFSFLPHWLHTLVKSASLNGKSYRGCG